MGKTVELRQALANARARTDQLFDMLAPHALYERPIPDRHRLIFYLGHVEAFDWNQVCRGALGTPSFHPAFDKLFEFGIDPEPGQALADKPDDWPGEAEVRAYNRRVRASLDDAIAAAPENIVHVAIEHRLMHAETLAYLLHHLPADLKIGRDEPVVARGELVRPEMVELRPGAVEMGRDRNGGFGWDNEFDAHTADVPGFAIGKRKVTNAEYLNFVKEGAEPPHFWVQRDGRWHQTTMFGETPLPLDWPVYVTHRQAAAYAQWTGKHLPSEAQYQRAAYSDGVAGGNHSFRRWNPVSVLDNDGGMVGNGWEWTSTVFEPFPGFQPFPFYPGYSANFFDGQHYVLKGASSRTDGRLLRPSFRNWFRPDYPYIYAGFRCVEN